MTRNNGICPVCGEGYLIPRTEQNMVVYNGVQGSIPLLFSECSACGSELAGLDESRKNKQEMLAFWVAVDNQISVLNDSVNYGCAGTL